MKKTTAAILIGAAVLGAGFIWHLDHGISMFALTDYGDKNTNSHSNAEIRDAVSTVRKEFQDYEGCIMTKLKYSEELTQMELDPNISSGIWEDQGTIRGASTNSFVLPVIPRRCDHFRLRLSGVGEIWIYSMSKYLEAGSDA